MSDGFGGDGFLGVGEVDNGDPPAPAGFVIVQTTAGLSNANSYIDIDYLYNYADEVGYQISGAETAVTVEQAILRAMPHAEARQAEFFGTRSTSTQSTAFPRTGTYANHARAAFIPEEIKRAHAAYTLAELSFTAATDNNVIHSGKVRKRREKTGPIEEEYEYFEGAEVFSNYGHARSKGDTQVQIIVTNSVVSRNLSYPLWAS